MRKFSNYLVGLGLIGFVGPIFGITLKGFSDDPAAGCGLGLILLIVGIIIKAAMRNDETQHTIQ